MAIQGNVRPLLRAAQILQRQIRAHHAINPRANGHVHGRIVEQRDSHRLRPIAQGGGLAHIARRVGALRTKPLADERTTTQNRIHAGTQRFGQGDQDAAGRHVPPLLDHVHWPGPHTHAPPQFNLGQVPHLP